MLQHRLVAHRGYQRKYPENTLLAMAEAVKAGARFLETDIQLTADGQPVLCHDAPLARCCGRSEFIHDLSLQEIQSIAANEPFRLGGQFEDQFILPLADFVDFLDGCQNVSAFIEIKEESIGRFGRQAVYDAVTRVLTPVRHRTILISFDTGVIAYARQAGYPKVGLVLREWTQLDSPEIAAMEPDYIFTNAKLIPHQEDLSRFDPLVVVYEIAEPERAVELFNRGVDMVETFDIAGMIESLAAHSL
jgi:glycerophosphoryl diester phosphodiesterase